jgi:hypothetical protein
MQQGTLYLLGRSSAVNPETGKEVVVEMLAIDTETDYDDYVRIGCSIIESGTVPHWAREAYRMALHYRTQVTKEVADEWLAK